MEWLWIILRYLFPLDPVRQCIAALCDRVGAMVKIILDDEALDELAADPDARIALEAALIDYEATLRLTISARAHQIAKQRFIPGKKAFHRPTRARSLVHLVKRIRVLALDCADIERLAQLQAERLKREHSADPLKLAANGSTDPAHGAAAHHAPVGALSSTGEAGGGGSPRLRGVTEGAAQRAETARAPPVFDVYRNETTRLAGLTCEVATRCGLGRALHHGRGILGLLFDRNCLAPFSRARLRTRRSARRQQHASHHQTHQPDTHRLGLPTHRLI